MKRLQILPPIRLTLFTLLVFVVSTIYITYPLVFNLGRLTTGFGDELLISWIMNWVVHALFSNPIELFNANIFYPFKGTLAYSDLHLTSSIIAAPFLWIFKQPIVAINSTIIFSLIALPFSIFLLSYFLTRNFIASLVSGLLILFSPAVLDKKVHVQALALYFVPLSALFFLAYLRVKKIKYLVLSFAFLYLQTINSFLGGYFIVFFYAGYMMFSFFFDKKNLKLFINRKVLFLAGIFIFFLLPIVIPYFKVSSEFNYVRDIRDTIHFALQPEDLLYPGQDSKLFEPLSSLQRGFAKGAEIKPGFIGFVFSILSLLSIFYVVKRKSKDKTGIMITAISILGLLLSLGPFLHLARQTIHEPFPIPLPYLIFYYLVPGFSGLRNSARFEMMFIIFIAPVIAIALSDFLKKVNLGKILIFSVVIFAIIYEFKFPMQFFEVTQVKDFPKAYSYLVQTPKDSKVIVMPIFNWNSWGAAKEFEREYFLTTSFRRTVNGASGFSPPPWQSFVANLSETFPNEKSVSKLKNLNINYIVIDKKSYDEGYVKGHEKYKGEKVVNRLLKNQNLTLVKNVDDFSIFEFKE